jgi:endonuclease/exonuclease/phosphatase family metal-dependent hydrolase
MKSTRWHLTVVALILMFSVPGRAETISLRIVGWNVESGDADPQTIASRIEGEDGVDVWGLSEVQGSTDAKKYEAAAEAGENADFKRIVGTTGGNDRLVVLYDSERLEKISSAELHQINIGGNVRAPLVVHFKGRTTGKEFLFMVNHLYRGSAAGRHQQSKMLNEWARLQSLPVIAVGDWNYDWHFQTGDVDHDKGYDHLTKDGVWTWVRPTQLVPSNASAHKSVLDFVFVSGQAAGWQYSSTILVQPNDFPDDSQKSDHRPVDAIFSLDTTPPVPDEGDDEPSPPVDEQSGQPVDQAEILRRIDELQRQIDELRRLVEPQVPASAGADNGGEDAE